ncbi:hypothetical protein PTTG_11882 [Puccinia triticina 1-1 BBBD Race 1]|uniref:Uncharacterized protein n=2 Tax=Puccinia triticina TaxID=208348 RepID=A0A180G279_PUCT1|nr:uncharacterized protein PtA15_1A624 [Puccinia triticina]OAV86771.1 hypothetical protein PTTG_11882 [Puccinia triticina 1-1 BBBD Race 1]WAQ81284.1 hypothetical protein PtA15_1A624 [Puccinia triticina]WAR52176.1 hypothetical protein PtB15_1B615 [Puccinia triticina]
MAKLTDLPAELIHRIIEDILQPDHTPEGPREAWDGRLIDQDYNEGHHLLDHNGHYEDPDVRPHHELEYREPTPRTYERDHRVTPVLRPDVSWPQGLPSNPLLPLSLVSRNFRRCAQEILFKNVPLLSTRRASLFLQALNGLSPQDESIHIPGTSIGSPDKRNARQEGHLSRLAQHVRTLQLRCIGPCSMDNVPKGGGSVFCDIIRSCPFLENVAIRTTFAIDCREPLLDALASLRLIKEFVIINNNSDGSGLSFRWNVEDLLGRLFPHWPFLKTVDLAELASSSEEKSQTGTIQEPKLNCALRTMILEDPDIDEYELSMLVKSFRDSMRTLEINRPAYRIGRAGICRILKDCTNPELESLKLDWPHNEQPFSSIPDVIDSDDPVTSLALLDILFKSPFALRELKSLCFSGTIATPKLFERLPDSIIKIAWGNCVEISFTAFDKILSNEKLLPNLECYSIRTRRTRDMEAESFSGRGLCSQREREDASDSEDESMEADAAMNPYWQHIMGIIDAELAMGNI